MNVFRLGAAGDQLLHVVVEPLDAGLLDGVRDAEHLR